MGRLTLAQADAIIDAALARARESGMKPLMVVVVDDAGNLKAARREDGAGGALRPQVALGKAFGAIGMGQSSRRLGEGALERPHFMSAVVGASGGRVIPVAGGVPFADADGDTIGAIGVSGDTSDNDELAAIAGIEAAGLTPLP